MIERISIFLQSTPWILDLLKILGLFLFAWIVARLSVPGARGLAKFSLRSPHASHTSVGKHEKTLQSLIANAVSFGAFTLATIHEHLNEKGIQLAR
jgi:hypothetical protein